MQKTIVLPECSELVTGAWRRIRKTSKLAFFSAFITGFLTHLYMFTGKYPNADEIVNLYTDNDVASHGRWLLKAVSYLSSDSSLPLVNGLFAILFLSLTAVVVVKLFSIERPVEVILTGWILVSFPTVCTMFTYMYCADGYAASCLLAALGAYVTDRYRRGWIGGALLLTLSLGIYQSFVCFGIALLYTRLLQRLLCKRDDDREILRTVASDIGAVGVAVVLYLAVTKLLLPTVTGVTLVDTMGVASMGETTAAGLFRGVADAYHAFFTYFFRTSMLVSWRFVRYLHLLIGLMEGCLLLILCFRTKRRSVLQLVLTLVLLPLLPLFYNTVYLMGAPYVHWLMIYSYATVYVLLFVLYDALTESCRTSPPKRLCALPVLAGYAAAALALTACLYTSVNDNEIYLALQLKYENSYALVNRVVSSVEQAEGYTPETPVYIGGTLGYGSYPPSKEVVFRALARNTGMFGESEYTLINTDTLFRTFARNYVGVILHTPTNEEIAAVLASAAYRDMPVYPARGSVQNIDGVIVVKASND